MPGPATTLEFPPYTSGNPVRHWVYVKRKWSDAWSFVPYLFCDSATWACAPTIPTAQLHWDAGHIYRQGRLQISAEIPLALGKYFVKIESECHAYQGGLPVRQINNTIDPTARLVWYGEIEVTQEHLDGIMTFAVAGAIVTGTQKFTAYGLAANLDRTPLDAHWWIATTGGSVFFSRHPETFNKPDAQGRVTANRSSLDYFFSDIVGIDDTFWSTRTIVKYLLKNHPPRKTSDPMSYLWLGEVKDSKEYLLPDWDKPVLQMRNKSVWQALCELLHRGRLLTFYVQPRSDDPDATLELHPVSLAGDDITTPEGTLQGNNNQFHLIQSQDRGCSAGKVSSQLQAVDQFVLQGAKRTTICSIGYQDGTTTVESTLEKGWKPAQETAYEAGGSGDAGYAAASNEEKQRRNEQARALDSVFEVYRRFQIPDAWSRAGKIKDGRGTSALIDAFVDASTLVPPLFVNPRELRILPTLPLKDGYDYTGISSLTAVIPPVRISLGPHENLRPLVFFQIPDQPTRWIEASQIGKLGKEETGKKQNHKMSVRVQVPQRDKAILLEVSGQPQHAIAYSDFSKLAADPYTGQWDWKFAVFTVALEDDRYCEGKYPSDFTLAVHDTELRRAVIDVGDDYRQDYIAPHTALGVDKNTGALTECTVGGYCQDDSKTLAAKAQLAWEYYRLGRQAFAFSTDRPTNALILGDYIATIPGQGGNDSIGSIVTEITVSFPGGKGPVAPIPSMHFKTGHAELDFLQTVLHRNRMY